TQSQYTVPVKFTGKPFTNVVFSQRFSEIQFQCHLWRRVSASSTSSFMMAPTGLTFFTPLTDSPAQWGIALMVPVVSLVMVKDSRGFTGTISPVEMSFLCPTMLPLNF